MTVIPFTTRTSSSCLGRSLASILMIGVCLICRRFLLGTGRMPHPVGGAMGVAL